MFLTKYSERKKVITEAGSPIKIEYQLRIKEGEEVLEPVGKTNLYEYIQSHADSVDIHKILERCALIQDYSILNQMPSQFIDTVDMPHTLAEAYSMIQDAQNFYDRMPLDIKQKYDNNFVNFITDIGSAKFFNVVGDFLNKKDENIKESAEVKTDES